MAYLYNEMTPDERAAFDAHLAECARCRVELNGLGDVRQRLSRWSPPSFARSDTRVPITGQSSLVDSRFGGASGSADAEDSRVGARRAWWREMPAWAQAAAALLVLGASAGIANLDVHYDARGGLNVRTGWSKPAPLAQIGTVQTGQAGADRVNIAQVDAARAAQAAPWRSDLIALEQQLRNEFHGAGQTSAGQPSMVRTASAANDAEIMRRIKTLLDESEKRHQRELALRVAEVLRDVNAQRQADLRRIDQNLGLMQDRTGVEVLRTRQAVDYLMQRVSQRQ